MRLLIAGLLLFAGGVDAQSRLPSRLSDTEFWSLSQQLSEPSGYFRSENYVSNEDQLHLVIPSLVALPETNRRVYLGVGPEQNYTYIATMRPQVAFIVDVRRGNLLQHLLYKALFELASDRVDFYARLFSRPIPPRVNSATRMDTVVTAFWEVNQDSALFVRNRHAVFDVLVNRHAFPLTPSDSAQIEQIYSVFFRAGPGISYSYGRSGVRDEPAFYEMVVKRDTAGVRHSFLATDSAFRFIKEMHQRNLIVPVVGDFAGPKALRGIGAWVRDRGETVGAFYLSNVEQYLFQDDRWRPFYGNLESLPVDTSSLLVRSMPRVAVTMEHIRAYYIIMTDTSVIADGRAIPISALSAIGGGGTGFNMHSLPIREFLGAVSGGKVREYDDLWRMLRGRPVKRD